MGDETIRQIQSAYAANARLLFVLPVIISAVSDGAEPSDAQLKLRPPLSNP